MSDEKKDVTDDETKAAEEENTAEEVSSEETSDESSDSAEESSDAEAPSDEDEDSDDEEEDSDNEEDSDDEEDSDEEEDSDDEEEDSDASENDSDASDDEDDEDEDEDEDEEHEDDGHGHGHDDHGHGGHGHGDPAVQGVAAFFDHPDHLIYAAREARDAEFKAFEAFSPFPIHGMDDAMGLGRSWIPWVTFLAGATGFAVANFMEFGIMWYDWPMVFGGRPFAAWPSFVPIMFELTVLLAGHTTAIVMLIAAGCFRRPLIIDPGITNDRFVLWISSNDDRFDRDEVVEFMKGLNPMEIRTVRKGES